MGAQAVLVVDLILVEQRGLLFLVLLKKEKAVSAFVHFHHPPSIAQRLLSIFQPNLG